LPFIGGAAVLALVAGATFSWLLAIPLFVLAGFFLFFFRDPDRQPRNLPVPESAVLAPADGRVLVAGDALADAAPPGRWKQISIFLSPMDVHVNRVPASGRVTRVTFIPGRFLPAYRHDGRPTSAARLRSIITARRSSSVRSWAFWPGAWCAVWQPVRASTPAIDTAS
jgi:phosphatidylserine decarboxylase precursor-related protein